MAKYRVLTVLSVCLLLITLSSDVAAQTRRRRPTRSKRPATTQSNSSYAPSEPAATELKVWNNNGSGQWKDIPGFPPGATMKVVNGNPNSGPADVYLKLPTGYRAPFHWHSATETLYFQAGTVEFRLWNSQQTRTVAAGGFVQVPPRMIHSATCISAEDCYTFVHSAGKFEIHVVDDQGNNQGMASQNSPTTYNQGSNSNTTTAGNTSTSTSTVPATVTLPEGTALSIRTIDPVDSETNKIGDIFHATLETPVTVGGRVVLPAGTDIQGRVAESRSAGRFEGRSDIALVLTRITMNGASYDIQTDELNREGVSRGKRTAGMIGGGAALGAIIGAIAGGGKGAAIGAGAGAAAGTGVEAATKGQQIRIPSESILEFHLLSSVTVTPGPTSTRRRLP